MPSSWRFTGPDSSLYWFEIVTWPGALALRGEMGGYLLSRVEDMLDFFRRRDAEPIDPGYWAEKTSGGRDSVRVFADKRVRRCIEQAVQDAEPQYPGLTALVEEELFSSCGDADLSSEGGRGPEAVGVSKK